MLIPSHRNPTSGSAPHLTTLGNPRLNPISNPALSPISNPSLSAISNPALNPISNPALSPISNPALSKISNPALSPISNPRLNSISNPGANPSSSSELDGFYLFDSQSNSDGYAVFATDELAIVYDLAGNEIGLAILTDKDYWLFLPPQGGAPIEQWWIVQAEVFVRFRNQKIVGLVT